MSPGRERDVMPDLLFTYGTLSPANAEDARRGGWEADAVRGRLFDLGSYPTLADLDDPSAGWVKGFCREVDPEVLSGRLDTYEGVDEGLFRRVEVMTRAGRRVWVYLLARPLPEAVRAGGPIERWDGRRVSIEETPLRAY